jgi:hypothetical protein
MFLSHHPKDSRDDMVHEETLHRQCQVGADDIVSG